MRLLLTNHHLRSRAGSELYCLELATALHRAGHQVGVFTFQPGAISDELLQRGVQVFTVGDDERLEAFDPEVLHVHHAPCLYYLGTLRLRAPVVFSALGVSPPLEGAPLRWEGVAHALGVSDEARDELARTPFGRSVPSSVLRNWFDDTGLTRPLPAAVSEARRVAVVTNHLDEGLARDLDALRATHPELSWTHFGQPDHSVEVTPELLQGFDRVITIGRTTLLAAALQKPCLVYDVYGCDGYVTAERLDALATRNFSGRLSRARPTLAELEHLLFEEARSVDVAALAERVWSDFSLRQRVKEFEALYARLARGGTKLDERARAAYGRQGRVHAEALAEQRRLQTLLEQERDARVVLAEQLQRLQTQCEEAEARARESEVALSVQRGELVSLGAALESARNRAEFLATECSRLADALSAKDSRTHVLVAELNSIETSLAWKMVNRVRDLKDRRLAVPGTRRRQVYDQLLKGLKSS